MVKMLGLLEAGYLPVSCPPQFLLLLIIIPIPCPASGTYMPTGVGPLVVGNLPEGMSPKEGDLSPSAAIS